MTTFNSDNSELLTYLMCQCNICMFGHYRPARLHVIPQTLVVGRFFAQAPMYLLWNVGLYMFAGICSLHTWITEAPAPLKQSWHKQRLGARHYWSVSKIAPRATSRIALLLYGMLHLNAPSHTDWVAILSLPPSLSCCKETAWPVIYGSNNWSSPAGHCDTADATVADTIDMWRHLPCV